MELKDEIIKVFESKGENFKKRMIREFKKKDPPLVDSKMYAYREYVLYDIFKELSLNNDHLFDKIDNPINLIEETLFHYLNSNLEL